MKTAVHPSTFRESASAAEQSNPGGPATYRFTLTQTDRSWLVTAVDAA